MAIKGYSDITMIKLWRQAVLIKNAHRCVLCGNTNLDELDCHHIVKRKNKILRYDYRNGVPVCRIDCHNKIDSIEGLNMIKELRPFDFIHLTEYQNVVFKQHLVDNGITEREFLEEKKKELKRVINAYDLYCNGI